MAAWEWMRTRFGLILKIMVRMKSHILPELRYLTKQPNSQAKLPLFSGSPQLFHPQLFVYHNLHNYSIVLCRYYWNWSNSNPCATMWDALRNPLWWLHPANFRRRADSLLSSTAIFRLNLPEARVKPERINVLVARTAANRGQRGHHPYHARGFASTSINCVHVNCNHVFFSRDLGSRW